jgi:hypothetical protein
VSEWRDQVERDELSAAARRYSERALLARDSQRFDFEVEGRAHSIVLMRSSFDLIGPRVEIDGEDAGRVMYPRFRRTFTERVFRICEREVVVALEATGDGPSPIAEVFLDGVSVVDGRSLEQARDEAPRPRMLVGRFFGIFQDSKEPKDSKSSESGSSGWDFSGGDEGCLVVIAIVLLAIASLVLVLLVLDVLIFLAGSALFFVAANTVPGRRSVLDAIRWRWLAVEALVVTTLVTAAAWWVRHH